jgi:hypothetical protein
MRSFSILRTNVGLTTNVKIMVDSKYNLSLSSIESSPELSVDKFKKVEFNKNNYYDELIPYFYINKSSDTSLPSDIAFAVKYDNDVDTMSTDFKNQYDEIYQYGARNISANKYYSEEFEYFAPLYINKNSLPSHFIIFRVDGSGLGLINKDNFTKEVCEKLKTVKVFDLGLSTNIGQWLDKNFTKNIYFPHTPLEMDFRELEFCRWNGIDYESGGYTSKPFFIDDFLEEEKEIFEFEKFIYESYKTNKVIFPNILNLSFLFDDSPSTPDVTRKWSLNRYYGFYLDSLESYETLSPYITPFLRDDVVILDGNILHSPTNKDPFLEGYSDKRPFYIEYKGQYYKVQQFLETQTNQLMNVPQSGGLVVEQYVNVSIEKYRIISDLDLTGKEEEINKNFGYIDGQNYLLDYQNTNINIDVFDDWSIWLIEIDGIYHNLIKVDGKIKINTDYSFDFGQNSYKYKIAGETKEVSFVVDLNNPPKKFTIYRANLTTIKDFDTNIIDTEYSKFEYELDEDITNTDETKLYLRNLNTKTDPKEIDDFIYKSHVVNIPTSSEYTANYETFKITGDTRVISSSELSDIWRKNPVYCRWSYQGSISSNDYPYCLNNSLLFEDFNRTVNPFDPKPSRIERNLDYFYSINSSTSSYSHHSLHIESYKDNDEIDENFNFELDKYLNLATYSVGTNSFATYSLDYFSDFFYLKQKYSNGSITKNMKKYSEFNTGDKSIPNSTVFRGLKFSLYDIDGIDFNSIGEINSINLSNNNNFDGWKFSILLSDNNESVDYNGQLVSSDNTMNWEIIIEWSMDKLYSTGSIVIFDDMLYQAQIETIAEEPSIELLGSIVKNAPYVISDWKCLLDSPISPLPNTTTSSIFWSPSLSAVYTDDDFIYNKGEYYYYDSTGVADFWNPIISTTTGYTTGSVVLFNGEFYRSNVYPNKWSPDFNIPSIYIQHHTSSQTFNPIANNVFVRIDKWTPIMATSSKWNPIPLWNPTNVYTPYSLVIHNDTIWKSNNQSLVAEEPGTTNNWLRKYSMIPDTDYTYNKNSNSIIQMNNVYYMCTNNTNNSTLDNGIVIYVNKKWKNILININISDNSLSNIKNVDRDELYSELYEKITASNFMKSINDVSNKYEFTDYVSYVVINEDGLITKHNYKNNFKSLKTLIKVEEPEQFNVKVDSLVTKPLANPRNLQAIKKLVNGAIKKISMLNWYNDVPYAVEIKKNSEERKETKNSHGLKNIFYNSLYRFNGYYMPTFYDVELFDKTLNGISENTKFDTTLSNFAIMKERKISKINRKDSVLKLKNSADSKSIYPMLDEFGYSTRDFFIFSSTWDSQYHWETIGPTEKPETVIEDSSMPGTIASNFGPVVTQNNQNYNL